MVCFSACVAVATRVGEARLRARSTSSSSSSSSSSPFLSARHPSCLFPGQLSATLLLLLLLLFFLPLFLSAFAPFSHIPQFSLVFSLSLSRITSFSFFRDLVSPPLPAIASAFFFFLSEVSVSVFDFGGDGVFALCPGLSFRPYFCSVERKEEEEVQGGVSDRARKTGAERKGKEVSVFFKIVRFDGERYLGEC